MNLSKQDISALILIDVQKGFNDLDYWGGHGNNPDAENNASRLLYFWRRNSWPVFHENKQSNIYKFINISHFTGKIEMLGESGSFKEASLN